MQTFGRSSPALLSSGPATGHRSGSGVWLALAAIGLFVAYSLAYKPPWYFVQLQHSDGLFAFSAFLDPAFLNKGWPHNYFSQRTPWVATGWAFHALFGDPTLANLLFKHVVLISWFLILWSTIRTFADPLVATIFAGLVFLSNQTTAWIGSGYATAGALVYASVTLLAAVRLLDKSSLPWAFVAGFSANASLVSHGYAAFILIPYAMTAAVFYLTGDGWRSCIRLIAMMLLGFCVSEVVFGSINFFLFGGKFWVLAHQLQSALLNMGSGNDYSQKGTWWLHATFLAPHAVSYVVCLIALARLDELGRLGRFFVIAHLITMTMAIGLERYGLLFFHYGYYVVFLYASTIPALAAVFAPACADRNATGYAGLVPDAILAASLFAIYVVAGRVAGGSIAFFQVSWALALLLLTIFRLRVRTHAFALATAVLFVVCLVSADSLTASHGRPPTRVQAARIKELVSVYADIRRFHPTTPVVLVSSDRETLPGAESLSSLFLQTFGGSASIELYKPDNPYFATQDYFVLVDPSCDKLEAHRLTYFADRVTKFDKAPVNNLCILFAITSKARAG